MADTEMDMRREQIRLAERDAQLDYDMHDRIAREHAALMRRLASTPPDDVGGIEG